LAISIFANRGGEILCADSEGSRLLRLRGRSHHRRRSERVREHAELIARVLAIPPKRHDRTLITRLTDPEIDALLNTPDPGTWIGRRDRTMLQLTIETGLGVSELTGLTVADVHLAHAPHVACHGKGRKDRITPLTKPTSQALRHWLNERAGRPDDPVFSTSRGAPLTRDAVGAASPPTRQHRRYHLPDSAQQQHHPARPAPHRRDAPPARRR
jgi:integrase